MNRFAGSKLGKFTKITVTNCEDIKPKCILKRGTNATVQIEFELSKSERLVSLDFLL